MSTFMLIARQQALDNAIGAAHVLLPDPQAQEWLAQLTNYYKFRHADSVAGMDEFIKAALQKPLPPKP